MKKWLSPLLVAVLITSMGALVACEDDVGVPCRMDRYDAGTVTNQSQIEQALDCRSRLCLRFSGKEALCTKTCDDSSDCPDGMEKCEEGFACIPAVETGPLRCCKVCVCKKFITSGSDAGVASNASCELSPNPDCPNL